MKEPDEITTLEQIQELATRGFTEWTRYGEVSVRDNGADLLIFNYTAAALYENRWNFFECVSRGLIINRVTGEIVARPFEKFFNWTQGGRVSTGYILTITEKIDGSLGILYRWNGEYRIATRGSFDSEQSLWATRFLNEHHDLTGLPDELTLLFEIIYPENRVVIDYHGEKNLVLLAARNRFTGKYIPYYPGIYDLVQKYHFSVTPTHTFNNITEIIEKTGTMDLSAEGYVVEFSDGQRFKFKGDRYLELHKLISGISFKHTLEAVAAGTVDYIRSQIPDEFLGPFTKWEQEIDDTVRQICERVEIYFNFAPKDTRKEFAQWVMANHKDISTYLFAMMDGKDIRPMIYKIAFQDRHEEQALKHSEGVA